MPLYKPNSNLYVIWEMPSFESLFIDHEQKLKTHKEAHDYARKNVDISKHPNYDLVCLPINKDGEIVEEPEYTEDLVGLLKSIDERVILKVRYAKT